MKLQDLAVDHDYYASESNYYSNEASQKFDTFADFFEEYHDADIDMNLVYRWDIKKRDNQEAYYMEVFMIRQRKGIYAPIRIHRVFEEDVENVVKFLTPHFDKLKSLWNPIHFELSQGCLKELKSLVEDHFEHRDSEGTATGEIYKLIR